MAKNIYLTPNYIETQRQKMVASGIDSRDTDIHIADFIARETKDPKFSMDYDYMKVKSPNSISGLLDFYAYGTTQPQERFVVQQAEEQKEPQGLFGKLKQRNVAAFGAESGAVMSALNPSETMTTDSAAGRLMRGEQGLGQTAFDIAGQAGGAIGDIFGAGVTKVAQGADFISGGRLGEGVDAIAESEVGQAVGGFVGDIATQYQIFKDKFPEAARNLENTVNIASVIPIVKTPQSIMATGRAAKSGISGIGKGVKGALSSLDDVAQSGKSAEKVAAVLQPKRTKLQLQELYKQDPSLITGAKGGVVLSSKGALSTTKEITRAKELLRIVPEIQTVKKPIDAGKIIHNTIVQKGTALDASLKNNAFVLPRKESASVIRKAVLSAADDFGESRGIFEAEIKRYLRFRDQFPGTGFGERQALIAYDADTAGRFGASIYQKGTARAEAVRAIREASQQTLEGAAQRAGVTYLSEVKDMRILYQALDDVATHVSPAVFESYLKSFSKTSVGRAATQAAGVSAGVGLLP
jgi:hypothetical protein